MNGKGAKPKGKFGSGNTNQPNGSQSDNNTKRSKKRR